MNRAHIRKLTSLFASPFPFDRLKKWSGQQFIFPFYHTVSNIPLPYISQLYPIISEKQFRNDLDFLLRKYNPASFSDVQQFAQGRKLKSKPLFFLSFDDGFAECVTVIAPILKQKGIEAAFFINPAFIDNRALSHRQKLSLIIEKLSKAEPAERKKAGKVFALKDTSHQSLVLRLKQLTFSDLKLIDEIAEILGINFIQLLDEFKPYMTLNEIKKLHDDGFLIGSHGYDHAEFNELHPDRMKQQIEQSFSWLENHLKIGKRIFSFPFTDHNIPLWFFEYLQKEANVVVSFGTAGLKTDMAYGNIQRIPVELEGFDSIKKILKAEYFYHLVKIPLNKNLIIRP